MTYASSFTGGDADSRRKEATRLLDMIRDKTEMMTPSELRFVEGMFDDLGQSVTGKQLLWLRDIKDKYL